MGCLPPAFANDGVVLHVRQARVLVEQGKFAEALQLLNSASPGERRDARFFYLRGYVNYRLNRFRAAEGDLRASVAAAPPGLESRYILGRIAEVEGRKAEAVRWMEPSAKAQPPIEDSAARLSKLLWELGHTAEALGWTERALTLAPWDGALHYRLGRIYQQRGEESRARAEFALSTSSKSADSEGVRDLMECARALEVGDKAAAETIRSKFLAAPALDPDLLVALGTTFATAGSPAEALQLYQRAAASDPSFLQAQFNLGLALLHVNDPSGAVAPLETSVRIAPDSKDPNAALALAYVLQDRYSEAVAPLEIAHAADPRDRKTSGLLSVAYSRSGSPGKAIPVLHQMLADANDDPKVNFLLVDCLNAVDRQQEALAIATEAATRFPQIAKSWLSKGQQLARLGRYREAAPAFEQAVSIDPNQKEAFAGLADSQQKDGRYEAALDAYRKAGPDLAAQLGEARCLTFLARFAEARDVLELAAQSNGQDSRVHAELSRVYAHLGDKKRAAEETRAAQRLRTQDGPAR